MSNNNQNKKFGPQKQSKVTRQLAKESGHGFQEFDNIEALQEFFTTNPDEVMGSTFEPPLFKRSRKNPDSYEKKVMEGKR